MDWSKRFKNVGLWVSLASLVPMVLQGFGVDVIPTNYDQLVNAVLSILVALGILSNPTTNNAWFHDDAK